MSHSAGLEGSDYWNAVAGAPFRANGRERTYYIGADELVWNYAPSGKNEITGGSFDAAASVYVRPGPGRIGASYVKCLYRQYGDATFARVLPRPPELAYLGLLGPVIRAEVGDTIKVVFRNGCRIPTSMHPHGAFYSKSNEGAPYADGTTAAEKLDDAVPPGKRYTYTWLVPERAGPGPHDGSSVMWMYHSHTQEVGDMYAGLMGPMVVTGAGQARPDGTPADVDQELFETFIVFDENKSPYLNLNSRRFGRSPYPQAGDAQFQESNLKHSINGYLFGNQPMATLVKGQHIRWYVMSMGNEVDLHTPHWHGNTVLAGGMRMDVVSLLPASMVVADMAPDNPGTWLFHCHVNDHFTAGMITRYRVVE
jgi:hephaestin